MKKFLIIGLIAVISLGATLMPRASIVINDNASSKMIKIKTDINHDGYFDFRF